MVAVPRAAPDADAPLPCTPAAQLIAAPAEVHPALALLYDLREQERTHGGPLPLDTLIEQAPAIEAAMDAAQRDIQAARHILDTLKAAPALPSATVPEGF